MKQKEERVIDPNSAIFKRFQWNSNQTSSLDTTEPNGTDNEEDSSTKQSQDSVDEKGRIEELQNKSESQVVVDNEKKAGSSKQERDSRGSGLKCLRSLFKRNRKSIEVPKADVSCAEQKEATNEDLQDIREERYAREKRKGSMKKSNSKKKFWFFAGIIILCAIIVSGYIYWTNIEHTSVEKVELSTYSSDGSEGEGREKQESFSEGESIQVRITFEEAEHETSTLFSLYNKN